jgi:tRNA U38,U39,U40 pseudouridine synthase TruA
LIKVGDGKFVKGNLTTLLKSAKRAHGYKTVEPHGLTLMEISYPVNSKLASQALMAKDMRSLDDN